MGLIDSMREWLSDCEWRDIDDPAEFDDMPPEVIVRGVMRHFGGGLTEFVREHMRSLGIAE